jgi:hypothetical protein
MIYLLKMIIMKFNIFLCSKKYAKNQYQVTNKKEDTFLNL